MIELDEIGASATGWHVNATRPVAEWAAWRVTPATPGRVFAGVPTYCYSFANEAAYRAQLAVPLTEVPLVNPLPVNIAALVQRIKADANRIVGDTIGNLGNEYTQANEDAKAFKAAAYLGTVPSSVSSWATAKGWTAVQACDDILMAATNWVGAQAAIRSNRLQRTEAAKACATQAQLDVVTAQWVGFVAAIRTSLGV